MQVKDLIVTGDAKILGNLYTKDGSVGAAVGGGGDGGSSITYRLTKSGQTITLTGSDGSTSSVTDSNTTTPVDLSGYVPTSRTVNGKALTGNISLSASDVGAAASSHTHSYAASSHTHDDRYFTKSEINSKLSGYSTTSHTHSGYAASNHTHDSPVFYATYGSTTYAQVKAAYDAGKAVFLRGFGAPSTGQGDSVVLLLAKYSVFTLSLINSSMACFVSVTSDSTHTYIITAEVTGSNWAVYARNL